MFCSLSNSKNFDPKNTVVARDANKFGQNSYHKSCFFFLFFFLNRISCIEDSVTSYDLLEMGKDSKLRSWDFASQQWPWIQHVTFCFPCGVGY